MCAPGSIALALPFVARHASKVLNSVSNVTAELHEPEQDPMGPSALKTTVIKKSISTFSTCHTTAALIASAIVIVSFVAFGNNGNLGVQVVSLSELENDSDVPQVDVTENQLEQSLENDSKPNPEIFRPDFKIIRDETNSSCMVRMFLYLKTLILFL